MTAGCLLVLLALTQIVPAFINTEGIAEQISAQIKTMTGEPFVHGDVPVSLLGTPKLIFGGVAIKNPPGTTSNYFLRADALVMRIGLIDLLMGNQPAVKELELVAPRIEMERIDADRNNWSFLYAERTGEVVPEDIQLTITQGEVIFTDLEQGLVQKVQGIEGTVSVVLGQLGVELSALYYDVASHVSGACRFEKFEHFGSFDSDCTASITQKDSQVDLVGRTIVQKTKAISKYSITVKSEDARFWGDVLAGGADRPFTRYYTAPLPVTLKAESYVDETRLMVNVSEFSSGKSRGKASVVVAKTAQAGMGKTSIWFNHLDYDALVDGVRESVGGKDDPFALREGFNPALSSMVDVRAASATFRGLTVADITANGQLSDGILTLSDARMSLPKQATLFTFGRISASEEGLSYEGQVEAHGDSLHALSPIVGLASDEVPADVFTQFRTRFNLIVRSRSMTLSELRLITGNDIRVAGGLNIFNEAVPRLDATLAVSNFDFTPMEKIWLKDTTLFTSPDQQTHNPYAFAWLKGLKRKIDLQLALENFTLLGMEGRDSSVQLKIRENEIQAGNISFNLDGSAIKGKALLKHDPARPRPVFETQLTISRINLKDYFLDTMWAQDKRSEQDSVWSRVPINAYPLHYYDGVADLRVRQITHDRGTASNVRALIQVADGQLTAKEAKAILWGGEFKGDVTIDSQVVPGLTLTFSVLNGQLADFFDTFVQFDNIGGLASLSGNLRFSGINFENWIDNLSGYFAVDARNVFVQHFNLPAIIRSIESVRAVSGLQNAVRLSFGEGTTRIGNINGTFGFNRGLMQTTRVTFRSNESVGELEGKLNLRKWSMEMAAKFGLVTLAQSNYPYLVVGLEGPVEMPINSFDTKSVEAFLAQRVR